jgi:small subunit ribosomal protein S18
MPKITRRAKPRDGGKKPKKKTSILFQERVTYVDYKDVNLLQRFVSDRSKIRARRVSGNDVQQQREVATAIKNAREMALLPYTKRVATQRGPRGGRGELGFDATSAAPAAPADGTTDEVVVEETIVEEVLADGTVEVEAEIEAEVEETDTEGTDAEEVEA